MPAKTIPGYPGYRKPAGRAWQEMRLNVFRLHGRTCHLCGHGGANQVDHVIPVAVNPRLAWTIGNLRPVHGVPGNRCQTCQQACNQVKQANTTNRLQPAAPAQPKPRHCDQPGCEVQHTGPGRCW